MQNLYPLFEQNRILKKELLWSLRDYSFAHIQLEYQDYGQGILQGCDITIQGNQLVVGPGIIKYGSFICLMMEEERIHYEVADRMQYLKIKIEVDGNSPDYIAYRIKLILDDKIPDKEKEFELCRFNLRAGAQLRAQYKDFIDLDTEYDTVNLIHADWGGLGGNTLAPTITRYFAETILTGGNCEPEDQAFAYQCLNQSKAVSKAVLLYYIGQKNESDSGMDNQEVYEAMCAIIKMIWQGGGKRIKSAKERHRILVD